MTTTIDGDSSDHDRTLIDSTTTTSYTTDGESRIHVDPSSAAVTITVASADIRSDHELTIQDVGGAAATNAISVETEGSETFAPGGVSSKSITVDNAALKLEPNAAADGLVAAGRNVEQESTVTDEASIENVAAKASLNSDQTIPTSTTTTVNLDTNDVEDSDVFDVQLGDNRIQAQADMTAFVVAAQVYTDSADWSPGDRIDVRLDVGGSTEHIGYIHHPGGSTRVSESVSAVVELSDGDNILMETFHDRGGDETIEGDTRGTYLSVHRVG